MSITNGYCTLAELKTRLRITDTTDDTVLEGVVQAVSRQVDTYCKRRFYKDTAAQARYYRAKDANQIRVDDLVSVSELAIDEDGERTYGEVWTTADYDLWPYNAAADNEPYLWIETTDSGDYCFPTTGKGVRVTGVFGWPAVPDVVHEAALIQSERIFKRRDAPFLVMGSQEMGFVRLPGLDADVKLLLEPMVRVEF